MIVEIWMDRASNNLINRCTAELGLRIEAMQKVRTALGKLGLGMPAEHTFAPADLHDLFPRAEKFSLQLKTRGWHDPRDLFLSAIAEALKGGSGSANTDLVAKVNVLLGVDSEKGNSAVKSGKKTIGRHFDKIFKSSASETER